MLSDIKNQLNQMQSQSAASAGRDAEAIAEVVRSEIRRAMMVRGQSGVTIQDTIDEKVAGFEREEGEDYCDKKAGASGARASTSGSRQTGGGLVMTLGRVRFADLEEGEVLGEGTFGTVLSGTYRGRDVAIKKARGALGSTPIMEAFRFVGEVSHCLHVI